MSFELCHDELDEDDELFPVLEDVFELELESSVVSPDVSPLFLELFSLLVEVLVPESSLVLLVLSESDLLLDDDVEFLSLSVSSTRTLPPSAAKSLAMAWAIMLAYSGCPSGVRWVPSS